MDLEVAPSEANPTDRGGTCNLLPTQYEGLIYYSGRDGKYRPIIVFDVKKTLDKNIPSKLVIDIYTYFLDFVVKNLLVEGHAENWVLVVDLNGSGVFNTIGVFKSLCRC